MRDGKLGGINAKIEAAGADSVAEEIGVGVPTLNDIVAELLKPGRDVRDSLPAPVLRSDLMDMNDLKDGMQIQGVVRNVTDFGAFVDISVHQDGLLHISEMSDGYVRHPSDVLKVGDKINVWVLSVDKEKQRIALTALDPATREQRKADYEKQKQERAEQKAEHDKKHKEWLERKAEREKRGAENAERRERFEKDKRFEGGRPRRDDGRDGRGEHRDRDDRKPFGRGERREFGERRSGYYDRPDDRAPSTENMSLDEKLAALAKRFGNK